MKQTIIVDFDGVLHSYTSKWEGAHNIPDPPVPGAMEFLKDATEVFDVCIVSSRSHQDGGIRAMRSYILYCLQQEFDHQSAVEIYGLLQFPENKPPAILTIDDRAFCFKGTFPTIEEIKAFKPWNKE